MTVGRESRQKPKIWGGLSGVESPRQKLILEEGGGAGFAEMWLGAVTGRQQACFLGHSSQRHRWGGVSLPQGQSQGRGLSGKRCISRRGPNTGPWNLATVMRWEKKQDESGRRGATRGIECLRIPWGWG